ncbi:MAG: guanylate kinase [Clostridiales bacterium]|nr:guanylate kinase [Clostridiales bacterium]MBR3057413.1 guanylate kinase [Clostridiales bacterium]
MSNGLIVSISGPSGVGKGTVIEKLREMFPDCRHSVSVTSRAPRGTEQDGVEYYFRTKEEFEDLIEKGEIIEYDQYVGNYYGTPLTPLLKMSRGGQDVLLDLTVPGSLALKEKFDDTVTIFLLPPSMEELRSRLSGRGTETEELVEKRMAQAKGEIEKAIHFDYVVTNREVQQAADEIAAIMKAENCRFRRSRDAVDTLLAQ